MPPVIGNPLWLRKSAGGDLYIVKAGVFQAGFAHTVAGYPLAAVTENYADTGAMQLYPGRGSGRRTTMYFTPKYTFPGSYRYLCCQHQMSGYSGGEMGGYGAISTIPASGSQSPTIVSGGYKHVLTSATNTLTEKATTYIDISGVSGEYWVCITVAGGTNQTGEFRCYNLWFSNDVPN